MQACTLAWNTFLYFFIYWKCDTAFAFTLLGRTEYSVPHSFIACDFLLILIKFEEIEVQTDQFLFFSFFHRLVWMSIYMRMLLLTYVAVRWGISLSTFSHWFYISPFIVWVQLYPFLIVNAPFLFVEASLNLHFHECIHDRQLPCKYFFIRRWFSIYYHRFAQ